MSVSNAGREWRNHRLAPARVADAKSGERPELQYGGERFVEACQFMQAFTGASIASMAKAPNLRGAAAVAQLAIYLPRLELRVTASEAGERIRDYLGYRTSRGVPMHRIAQGVLTLPEDPESYLRGRSRQAVRTNMRRAQSDGITTAEVVGLAARRDTLAAWQERCRDDDRPPLKLDASEVDDAGGRIWLAAPDGSGTVLALAIATVDREWAMLEVLVASDHPARWLLHTVLVQRLVAAGVRYVFTKPGNALVQPENVQHVQRLMGYKVVNISLPKRT